MRLLWPGPIADLFQRHPGGPLEVRQLERAFIRWVGDGFERFVRHAQIRRARAGDLARDHHVRRHLRVLVPDLFRHDAADTRVDVFVRRRAGVVPREADLIPRAVPRVVVVQAADDAPLLHDFPGLGKHVGQVDPRHGRGFGAEFTAELGRGAMQGVEPELANRQGFPLHSLVGVRNSARGQTRPFPRFD